LLSAHYGIPSRILRILSPEPPSSTTRAEDRKRILWVGRISPEKRPHLLLDVARRLPDCTFDMIGDANADLAYAREFRREVERHPSIVLHGRVSSEQLHRMYDEAMLLVGTSQTEGFPVTFIEAWSRGIPIVSTFDPDGVIQTYGLGYVAQDAPGMASRLSEILQSPGVWLQASQTARQYYLQNHAPEVCLPKFERLFLDVVGRNPSACACTES
jgi:glycosyltransferase involved in cell wall biosynthesis